MNHRQTDTERKRGDPYAVDLGKELRTSRKERGISAIGSAVAALGITLYNGIRRGVWINDFAVICAGYFVVYFFVYRRLKAREANLDSIEQTPNQLTDPTLSSVTPPAGQESRPR
jgi:hypothetical protein